MVEVEDEGRPCISTPSNLEAPGRLTLEGLIIVFHGGNSDGDCRQGPRQMTTEGRQCREVKAMSLEVRGRLLRDPKSKAKTPGQVSGIYLMTEPDRSWVA